MSPASRSGRPTSAASSASQPERRPPPRPAGMLARKAYNVVWYFGRVVWFAFPWSLVLLVVGIRRGRAGEGRAGVVFAVATVLLYMGVFSLFDRRAERYLF